MRGIKGMRAIERRGSLGIRGRGGMLLTRDKRESSERWHVLLGLKLFRASAFSLRTLSHKGRHLKKRRNRGAFQAQFDCGSVPLLRALVGAWPLTRPFSHAKNLPLWGKEYLQYVRFSSSTAWAKVSKSQQTHSGSLTKG